MSFFQHHTFLFINTAGAFLVQFPNYMRSWNLSRHCGSTKAQYMTNDISLQAHAVKTTSCHCDVVSMSTSHRHRYGVVLGCVAAGLFRLDTALALVFNGGFFANRDIYRNPVCS